jgi:Tfp pilus assembly protein FimT
MHRKLPFHNRGITLIEILLFASIMVILVSFASASFSGATDRTELRAATEHLDFSIRSARNTARMAESEVQMHVLTDSMTGENRVTFTLSEAAAKKLGQSSLQEYLLDESLRIVSDQTTFSFDGRGIVEKPGQITLLVRNDESIRNSLIVE